MNQWVEFEVQVECQSCGNEWVEHMEFDAQNRTHSLMTDWRDVECECGNKFAVAGTMEIQIGFMFQETEKP